MIYPYFSSALFSFPGKNPGTGYIYPVKNDKSLTGVKKSLLNFDFRLADCPVGIKFAYNSAVKYFIIDHKNILRKEPIKYPGILNENGAGNR